MPVLDFFPPRPRGQRGRVTELATLARTVVTMAPGRIALVGAGGSGKSMLAAALGHALAPRFGGRIHWFRIGKWDFRTLTEMMALRFGTPREHAALVPGLRAFFARREPRLVVLDNHEDDQATAQLLDALAATNLSFVITARRCLLGGVLIFPVIAPMVTAARSAFPRVAPLTRALRWNPLALDLADAIVASGGATLDELRGFLEDRGVRRVRVLEHEDDLPEVALLVDWAWRRISPASRRMLGALAHVGGDHVDAASLAMLARVRRGAGEALEALLRWHMVQEPMRGRYALHAVIRHAVLPRETLDQNALFEHYVALLEQAPERLQSEQTHLFAAMDHAHRTSDLDGMLRIERLLARLESDALAPRAVTTARRAHLGRRRTRRVLARA